MTLDSGERAQRLADAPSIERLARFIGSLLEKQYRDDWWAQVPEGAKRVYRDYAVEAAEILGALGRVPPDAPPSERHGCRGNFDICSICGKQERDHD